MRSVVKMEQAPQMAPWWKRAIHNAGLSILMDEARALLRPDLLSGLVVLLLLLAFLPSIDRHAKDARTLAAFVDDEPLLTMQVDGMTARPYGNPANYLDTVTLKRTVPPYWYNLRYTNIPYYGGVFLDLAWIAWLPPKFLGSSLFPTVPVILRSLLLAFTCCTILAAYNFTRLHLGQFAAICSILYLATDVYTLFTP